MNEPASKPQSQPQPTGGPAPVPPRPAGLGATGRPSIRTIGMERAPHKDVYHFILARSWPTFFAVVGATFLGTNLAFACPYWPSPAPSPTPARDRSRTPSTSASRPSRPSATAACTR